MVGAEILAHWPESGSGERRAPTGHMVLRLLLRAGAEEEGIGKGHFLEGHGFEGCCVRKLRNFYIQKEALESEGRKDEWRAGWGHRA